MKWLYQTEDGIKEVSDIVQHAITESGVLECIDDCYIDRGDWLPLMEKFAKILLEKHRDKCNREELFDVKAAANRLKEYIDNEALKSINERSHKLLQAALESSSKKIERKKK